MIGAFQYISPSTGTRAVRIFYQMTSGDIVSLFHRDVDHGPFQLYATVIATGLPLGTTFAVSALVSPNEINNVSLVIELSKEVAELILVDILACYGHPVSQ